MEIFETTLDVMERSMDVRMANQRLAASNLANINTPGYRARRIDFEATMRRVLEDPTEPESATPVIYQSPAPSLTLDGNNVDLDEELSQIARNRLMYSLTSQMLAAKLRQFNSVIDGQK